MTGKGRKSKKARGVKNLPPQDDQVKGGTGVIGVLQEANAIFTRAGKVVSDMSKKFGDQGDAIARNLK